MSDKKDRKEGVDNGKPSLLRLVFEGAAMGVAATATVAAVVTGPTLPAMLMGVGLSAAYLLKKRQ